MNSKVPFFSVVIPVYNKEKYIEKTIQSVILQNYKDFEVIFVNDGSTDSSESIVKRHLKKNSHFSLVNQINMGAAEARNSGTLKAVGNYIAFLDADDYWYNNHLKVLHKSILQFPNEKVFCTNYEMEFENDIIVKPKFSITLNNEITLVNNFFDASHKNCIASTPSIALERNLAIENLFDKNIKSGQDTDLFIRLALKNKYVFNKTITVRHIRYAIDSLSKSKFVSDRYIIIKKHKDQEIFNLPLKRYLDMNRFSIAIQYLIDGNIKMHQKLKNDLNRSNLSLKRRVFLLLPTSMMKLLNKNHSSFNFIKLLKSRI